MNSGGTLTLSFAKFLSDPARAGWVFTVIVGLTITLTAWAVLMVSASRHLLRRRLNKLQDDTPAAAVDTGAGWLSRVLARLRPWLEPRAEAQRNGLQERLLQAGLRSDHALTVMYACKVLGILLLPTAVAVGAWLYPDPSFTFGNVALAMVAAAALGFFLPNMYLSHRHEKRKSELLAALPDALDLLVSCTEAGLGLNAALERVADQLPAGDSDLAPELQQVNAEIRAGVDRTIALRNLADRTGLEDIRGLVALITHSMRFGTGIADTLRIYAEEFRDKRMQRAEALAAVVGTKLIFPLCFCIFPAFFVVATGPAVVGVMHVLGTSNVVWPGDQ